MQQLILLVVALPFISAVLTQIFNVRLGKRVALLSVASMWLTFVLSSVMYG